MILPIKNKNFISIDIEYQLKFFENEYIIKNYCINKIKKVNVNKNAEKLIRNSERTKFGKSIYFAISLFDLTELAKLLPLKTMYSFQFSFLDGVFGKIGGMIG